jgi:hypothetical protein
MNRTIKHATVKRYHYDDHDQLRRLRRSPASEMLSVDSAVLDREAILLRLDNTSDFDGLRSRQGQADAVLVAYDVMDVKDRTCGLSL